MSIDCPERRPLSEWRHETVPTVSLPSRTRIMATVHDLAWKATTSRRLWDQRRRTQVCSCSGFTRLLLVQLIFVVTDRSRNHGHAS